MKMTGVHKWLGAALLAAAAGGIMVIVVVLVSSRPGSASAHVLPAQGYTPSPFVENLAEQANVGDLSVLRAAGKGDSTVSIVTGRDPSGAPCWTVTVLGGQAGNGFRCGTAPVSEGAITIFPDISGPSGSTLATSVALVGLARSDVASVRATLVGGSTTDLPLTNGTFGYAASDRSLLPTVVRAYGKDGRLLGEQALELDDGPPSP
jgi:hypothetical protein